MVQMARSNRERFAGFLFHSRGGCLPGMLQDIFVRVIHPHIYVTGIPTCECNLCRGRRPPFSEYPEQLPECHCNTHFSQTVKDVRSGKDTLVDIFERMEMFFRRVEVYTEAQPTSGMMDIIIRILVEVLSILGIATKEIKQSRLSKYSIRRINISPSTERPAFLEKFGKKLIGRTDMEDALKKLDKLTHEEAWMGIAQNLKATHTVGESVRRVADEVVAIDNKVAGVDERVTSVGDQVASVDDRVRVVDDRVTEVIRGA